VAEHMSHLVCDEIAGSTAFRGGQAAADATLAAYDVTGYAARRNQVLPESDRGASRLSPYIRHGLVTLGEVWDHVTGGPARDVSKFRDELMWQEYSRHWYARLGERTRQGVRHRQIRWTAGVEYDTSMACVDFCADQLATEGWLVNQTRMWMASEWTVRRNGVWHEGEDHFFRHLLDGSRAANRLGWQWTTGVGSHKHYGFSRRQVERRAPELCAGCGRASDCPIQHWPDAPPLGPEVPNPDPSGRPGAQSGADAAAVQLETAFEPDPGSEVSRAPGQLRLGEVPTTPIGFDPVRSGPTHTVGDRDAERVWLTAESLGTNDPALVAHPEMGAVFVFDEPLLARLRLSSKRLVFLVETLAELSVERELELHLGSVPECLTGTQLAVTFAPVPGFERLRRSVDIAALHPWPWLARPTNRSVRSFSAWRKGAKVRR